MYNCSVGLDAVNDIQIATIVIIIMFWFVLIILEIASVDTLRVNSDNNNNDNIIIIIELTHSKTILGNTVEIEPQPVALDFKNVSQYSSCPK